MTDHDDDTYTLPPADDTYWDSFIAAGHHQPTTTTTNGNHPQPEPDPDPAGPPLRITDSHTFAHTNEPTSEPLLGTHQDTLLPASGMLLMYGDGGAGKTTLTIDAIAHLATGNDWLGITTPRPLRILLIENEGPRGKLRQRIHHKGTTWPNQPFWPNLDILEEPWQRFTLTNPDHRHHLAHWIDHRTIDILIVGPLASIGAIGGGTPEEVNHFLQLLDHVRQQTTHPWSSWIVHHENKAGDVSGAWERVPDSLVHIQSAGNGHTKIVWRKTRWSSTHHGTTTLLTWADNYSYTVDQPLDRDIHAELLQALQHVTDTDGWRTRDETATLIKANKEKVAAALSDLVDQGHLEYAKGPKPRHPTAHCWRYKTITKGRPDAWATSGDLPRSGGVQEEVAWSPAPVRGDQTGDLPTTPPEVARPARATYLTDDTDDQEIQRLLDKYGDHPNP